MATPWQDPIRNSRRLTVFAGSSVTGGVWASVIASAIAEFNQLSAANTLGVTLSQSTIPPDPSGTGGADVQVESGSGTVSFTTFGQQISVPVSGTGLEGNTQQVKVVFGGVQRIAKAFIVVPATPQINANPPRGVGDGVKLVIVVHEMVHACGLSNSDHNSDDLFSGFPQARAGTTPQDDKIEVNQQRRLPPLFLTAKTAGVIRSVW